MPCICDHTMTVSQVTVIIQNFQVPDFHTFQNATFDPSRAASLQLRSVARHKRNTTCHTLVPVLLGMKVHIFGTSVYLEAHVHIIAYETLFGRTFRKSWIAQSIQD